MWDASNFFFYSKRYTIKSFEISDVEAHTTSSHRESITKDVSFPPPPYRSPVVQASLELTIKTKVTWNPDSLASAFPYKYALPYSLSVVLEIKARTSCVPHKHPPQLSHIPQPRYVLLFSKCHHGIRHKPHHTLTSNSARQYRKKREGERWGKEGERERKWGKADHHTQFLIVFLGWDQGPGI